MACFQTTHVWGNLVSSVLLGAATSATSTSGCAADDNDDDDDGLNVGFRQFDRNSLMYFDGVAGADGGAYCGTYDTCEGPEMLRRSIGAESAVSAAAAVTSNASTLGE